VESPSQVFASYKDQVQTQTSQLLLASLSTPLRIQKADSSF
jgi:hypothetical protein